MTPATTTARMMLPLLLAAAGLALAAPRTPEPWRLRPRVEVRQAEVRLADLLAAPTAAASPTAAQQATALAAAPQPGTPLVWNQHQVAARLAAAGLPAEDFAIPARLEIERRAQPVAAAQVQQALEAYLRRPVARADIAFAPPLTTSDDPGLAVERVRPDPLHGELVAICRARNDPRLVPFVVTVRLSPAEMQARRRAALVPAAAPSPWAAPFLVQPGRPAQWIIANSNYALTSQVIPLQAGRAGEVIRARSQVTHAVVRVVVAGRDQVRSAPETAAEAFHAH